MRSCIFLRIAFRALTLGSFILAGSASAQSTYSNLAGEYAIVGNLPGDQVNSHVAINANGGWVVWSDNATDGFGAGISARRLNAGLSGDFNVFRVNEEGAGEQEFPKVALLQDGGAVFVWQGGALGFQNIYLRVIDSAGVFKTGDVLVNTYAAQQQIKPSVAVLNDGNVVVVWSSLGQDGSMLGVYGRVFSSDGVPLGGEFRVNEQTEYNQRDPQVAALSNGGFVISWITEEPRQLVEENHSVSRHLVRVVGRLYNGNGEPQGGELLFSGDASVCANPALVAVSSGGFVAGWTQMDSGNPTNNWDVVIRSFDSQGQPVNGSQIANTYRVGDQFGVSLASQGDRLFAVWTSLRQDGSYEGVFGRFFNLAGVPQSDEMQVNTTAISSQIQPVVAADGASRFLVVWSSFIGGVNSHDLFAQRYVSDEAADVLYAPEAPYVTAISSTELSVTWPELAGYDVVFYEVYLNSDPSPVVTTNIHVVLSGLVPSSYNSVRLLYELADGRRSPLSSPTVVATWGEDNNGDGLPDDWQASIWGSNPSNWPAPDVDSDGDGASNYAEFLAGTNPLDPTSVLRIRLQRTQQGMSFSWTTVPGCVYQVQSSNTLGDWSNIGSPRFAHATVDSIDLAAGSGSTFYRVIRLR